MAAIGWILISGINNIESDGKVEATMGRTVGARYSWGREIQG